MASPKQTAFLIDLMRAYPTFALTRSQDGVPLSADDWPSDRIGREMRTNVASEHISAINDYAKAMWQWRPLSKQSVTAEILYRVCKAHGWKEARKFSYGYAEKVAKEIGIQEDFKPFVFTRNENGMRVPIGKSEAIDAWRKGLSVVKSEVNKKLANQDDEEENQDNNLEDERNDQELDDEELLEEEAEEEEKPEIGVRAQGLFEWTWQTGEWCESRDADGHPIDSIGMRPFADGAKMFSAGIPIPAIKYAMTMHWPEEARRAVGVDEFDPATYKPENRIPGMHKVTPYVLALIEQRIPVCLIGKSGCLSADTIINVNRAGKGSRMTIEHLVKMHNGGKASGRIWNKDISTYVARNDNGVVRLARLADAWESGVKLTYKLTTETGRTIRGTEIHPFETPNGFVKLDELEIGDYVNVNIGRNEYVRVRNENYRYKFTKFHPNQVYASDGRNRKNRVLAHRLVVEADMNGVSFDDFVWALNNDEQLSASFTYLSRDLVVHHEDEDQRNNALSNLKVITSSDHAKLHDGGNHVLERIGTERIVSIENYGLEMTYDIEVVDDPHCFLANGFVVHNTGKTTLAGDIAKHLFGGDERRFGFVSMTRGTSPSAFNGRPRIADDGSMIRFMKAMADGDTKLATEIVAEVEAKGDVVMSQFVKIYGGGGVYLFDELDAGDENLLLLVNAALSNGQFANAATGEIVDKHPDFIPMAGMNSMGLGATRDHNARNRLDHATMDRWRMGRVQVKLDRDLTYDVFKGIVMAEI